MDAIVTKKLSFCTYRIFLYSSGVALVLDRTPPTVVANYESTIEGI